MDSAVKMRVAKRLDSDSRRAETTEARASVARGTRPAAAGRGDAPQRERNPWRTAFLILLAVIIGLSSGWAYVNFGPSKLQFSITDALSGNPVSDAIVSVYNSGALVARCITHDGGCSLSVSPGHYQGAIASSNYSSKQFTVDAQGAFNMYVLTVTPSFNTVIQPGSMVTSSAYTIFSDSVSFFARNGTTGAIDASGSSASTVINAAISKSVDGATISIVPGNYSLASTLLIEKRLTLSGQTVLGPQSGTWLWSTTANPVVQVDTNINNFNGFAIRNLGVHPCLGCTGLSFLSGAAGFLSHGYVENVIVCCEPPGGPSGTGKAFLGSGLISTMFVNDAAIGSYYGYAFNENAGLTALSNFNMILGGVVAHNNYGVAIFDGSTSNIIDGVDFESNHIYAVFNTNGNHTTVQNSWMEATGVQQVHIDGLSVDTLLVGNTIQVPSGTIGIYDNGTRTLVSNNQFAGAAGTTGTFVSIGGSFLMGYYAHNVRYNPIGKIASPFTNFFDHEVGLCGKSCVAAPSTSTAYKVAGSDILVTTSGGIGLSITIKDPQGNTVASGLANVTAMWIPYDYTINFGAFSGSPTVTVFGN